MEVKDRLKLLRKALKLTQTEFGEKIGKSLRAIQNWELGVRNIPEPELRLISKTFGVSLRWLLTGEGEMFEKKEGALLQELSVKTEEVLEKLVRIPVVGRAGAEFPEAQGDLEVIGYVFVGKETFRRGGKFAVQVSGDSMEPTLRDGDCVVFKTYTGDASDIPSGKVVVVRNHYGELVLKRLARINGMLVLTSDNPKYPPITYEQAQAENLQIVGVGVKILREIEL